MKPVQDMQGPAAGGDGCSQLKEIMQIIMGGQLVEKHQAMRQKAEEDRAEECPGHGGTEGRKQLSNQGFLLPHILAVLADSAIHIHAARGTPGTPFLRCAFLFKGMLSYRFIESQPEKYLLSRFALCAANAFREK